MLGNIREIQMKSIMNEVHKKKDRGFRFVTMTAVENADETFDLFYHFDKDYYMENIKVKVQKDIELQSISKIYLAACFVENEIQELFGIQFEGKAINYGGHFILGEDQRGNPMCKNQIVIEQLEDK